MSSRIATVTLLAVASLMLTSGTAFATSALSTETNASSVQYGSGVQTPQPTLGGGQGSVPPVQNAQQTLGATDEGSVPPVKSVQQVAAGSGERPEAAPAAAQAPRQLVAASDTSSLPFTGLALIPILLFGVALLTVGLVLRRRGANAGTSI